MRGERAVWFPVQDYATWFFTLVRHIFNRCTQERNLIDLESQSLLFATILLICNIYISPQSCFKKLYKLLLGKNLCSKKIGPVQSRCAGLGVERGFTGRRDVSDKEMILKELVSRSSLSKLPMHILIQ